jgi:hypothetical protein
MAGIFPWAPEVKVFCFFSSEKKTLAGQLPFLQKNNIRSLFFSLEMNQKPTVPDALKKQ